MSLEPTTNFKDSNGVDLGSKLVTKDYLISVYPSIGEKIGIPPELWVWGNGGSGRLGNFSTTNRSTPVTTSSGGSNWKQISAGGLHTSAIKTDGTLWTWGNNIDGQLGTGDTTNRSTPVTTSSGGTNWKYVSSGYQHTLALKTDGTLWTWGNNTSGQLGKGTELNPYSSVSTPITTFAGGTNWVDVLDTNPEDLYTLSDGAAIKTDGTLWVWGSQYNGRLGNAVTTNTPTSTPITTFAGGSNWKQVFSGGIHQAAIKTDGTLWIWGDGFLGALGNATVTTATSTPVTTFAGGTDWKQVSAGEDHTAAIKTDGTLWTWGNGTNGQHGNGATISTVSTPVTTFTGGTNWKQVSCGYYHTTAIKTDGTLWVWGNGDDGRLGNAATTNRSTPVTTFSGGTNWKQVSCGYDHSAAIKTDGTLWTWGSGASGTLGNAVTTNRSTPVTTFAGGTNWKQVSAGFDCTTAIKTDGTLWTWGLGSGGQLGNASTTNVSTPVTTFAGGTNWKQVSGNGSHTIALRDDGINKELYVFGGRLGNATTTTASTPVTTFAGGTNWANTPDTTAENLYTISTGGFNPIAIKTDGTLWTWGSGSSGRLGNNDTTTRSTPITTFTGGTNWRQLSAGGDHTSAIKTDGTLWTWGNGALGQLGTDNLIDRSTPITTFAGGTNWADTATTNPEDLYTLSACSFSAAIKTDGTLWTWGLGTNGQLGTNDITSRSTPVTTFTGGTNWKQVSVGYRNTAAIKTDGTLWTWGLNGSGRLGNNNTTSSSTPITTFSGGTDWKQVSFGYSHVLAIKTDGTLWSWGSSAQGELGRLDAFITRYTPVTTFAGGTNWADTATTNPEDLYTLSAGGSTDANGGSATAAIKTDGTLWVWGNGGSGRLGNAVTTNVSTPVTTFFGGTNWKQVIIGNFANTLAIKTDGTLWVWGNGGSGKLGNFATTNRSTPVTTFAGGTDWKQASFGTNSVAAVKTDGTLWTWGSNGSGRLGTNDSTTRSTPVTTFAGGTDWKHVSISGLYTAAVKTDGTLWTWGSGGSRLGIGALTDRSTPVTTFAGGTDWRQVSAGYNHMAAIKTDGTLWVWGTNAASQLGINATNSPSTPVTTFAGGTDWKQVSGGTSHTTAIKTDGTLWTWGNGLNGRLGTNDQNNKSIPVTTFVGGTNWKQASAGFTHTIALKDDGTLWNFGETTGFDVNNAIPGIVAGTGWKYVGASNNLNGDISSCSSAIKTDGTLWVWGNNDSAQLGTNSTTLAITPITTFAGGTNWKQVNIAVHTAAVKTDGTLWTWGSTGLGRLGNGLTVGNISTPVTTFAGGTDWKQVSSGFTHSTAIKTDGTLWTWGSGTNGRLGNANTTNISTPVTTFAGGTNWKQVSAGFTHTIALKDDGVNKELYVFGNGSVGTLGNLPVTFTQIPDRLTGNATDWKQVSNGQTHTAAIKTDGTLWTWGNNGSRQIGNFSTISTISTPVTTFSGGTNWKQVSGGHLHTAAIKTDGTLWTWGSGTLGRLGNGITTTNRSTPITTFAGGTNWKQVSAGFTYVAAIKTDGTLWVWGNGANGRLGNGVTTGSISTPVTTFAGGTDWKQVNAGLNSHTAAVKTDGTLWVWGNGSLGQLGNNSTTSPSTPVTTFVGGTNWKQVSSGDSHTVALSDDGVNKELYVFGNNILQQLGTNVSLEMYRFPGLIFGSSLDWKQIDAGDRHTAAIKTDGTLWTWGNNTDAQLGTNDTQLKNTPVTTFAGGTNWKQASGGGTHTSAIKTDGTLWSWGNSIRGQLGIYPLNIRLTPVTTFAGGNNWADTATGAAEDLYTISAGENHTAAIKTDGTLWIWGNNFVYGKLGTNDLTSRSTPVTTFAGGTDWKQISTGYKHTAAIKTDGTLWTWGYGSFGILGNNNTTDRSTPVTTFVGGTDWKQVSCGETYTAAVKTDGTLWTWGNNTLGQLGRLSTFTIRETPVTTFAGGTNWADTATTNPEDLYTLSAGNSHTAAIKTDGTLWTWGNGGSGRLGNAATTKVSTPVTTFAGGTNWKQVSSAFSHTAAIKTDGTLWTWGSFYGGQLGNGAITDISTPITTFAGGTDWKQVSAGFGSNYVAAIKTDGTLWTWGFGGDGRLGIGATTNRSTPVTTFAGGTDWKQVNSAWRHTVAIKTDGTLWTWGNGLNGRLGTNDTTNRSTPITTFAGGTDWKQVSAGDLHSVAVKTDGTLWTWGNGGYGRLGNFSTTDRSTPVTTFTGGTDWKQVSAGDSHTAAIKTDGTLWTWGFGGYGRLGNNDLTSRSTPVTTFAGGTNWKQVSAGEKHTIALRDDGVNKELYVFGDDTDVQLGINYNYLIPDEVGGTNWKQVSSGYEYTSAIKTDGTLWTWGNGNDGRLGTNDTINRLTPVTTFAGGTNWKQVSNSKGSFLSSHTSAIKTDGTLWTWGYNSTGQLGNANLDATSTPVTTFAGGTNWKQVSCSGYYTTAVKTDGTLWTWGDGSFGQLGNNSEGSNEYPSTPVTTFAGGTNWKQVSAGDVHTIALKDDGINKELYVFGSDTSFQLGIANPQQLATPVTTFAGGTNWKQVSAGNLHTAAIKTDGTLWTCGFNLSGQLGNFDSGIQRGRTTPVTTFTGGTNWKQVSAGDSHTAAIKTDGTLWTWGNAGNDGRLGNASTTNRSTPVTTFVGGTNWKQVSSGDFHTAAIRSVDF